MTERFKQCVNSIVSQCVNDECPNSLDKAFEKAPENIIQTRGSWQNLKCAFIK